MATWIRAGYPGVYYREHATRKLKNNDPDRYYAIKHSFAGRPMWEAVGWASEGESADSAASLRLQLKENVKRGGPVTLADLAAEHDASRKAIADQRRAQAFTVADLAALYIDWARANKKTHAADAQRIRDHILPVIGRVRLADLNAAHVNALKTALSRKTSARTGRPLGPSSVTHCLGLVRSMINLAPDLGAPPPAGPNPARLTRRSGRGVRLPRADRARLRVLTPGEISRLLDGACLTSRALHDACLISLDTGMRLSEILTLQPQHVQESGAVVHILDPKSGQSRTAYPSRSRPVLARRAASGPWLFPGRFAGRRDASAMSHAFDRLAAAARLNAGIADNRLKAVFHSLRHTYGTMKYIETRDLHLVQKLLGHESIATTEKYVHLADSLLRRLAAAPGP